MRILKLNENDGYEIRLVKNSLIGLRKCYPNFGNWFDSKVLPNLKNDREIFLAERDGDFKGALILKNGKEKKVCTLYVVEDVRNIGLGNDFIRIATEELQTYKLPITISEDAKNYFFNSNSFNFYQKNKINNMYMDGMDEYIGYIMAHNQDLIFRRNIC